MISEQEAFSKIQQGMFVKDEKTLLKKICVNEVTLIYEVDSKGIVQPVYQFDVVFNDKEKNIIKVPAWEKTW